jgi:AcrR family transcriptional regulator
MKKAFYSLSETKRERLIAACLSEFGARDFDKAALDRIVEAAGISKGGLYEYISTKEELYLFIVEYSYSQLYDYIKKSLDKEGRSLPDDLLERFAVVARIAIDFYIEHPSMIGIIARTSRIDNPELAEKAARIFDAHFSVVFASAGEAGLAVPKARLVEFLKWILIKTRNDFLREISSGLPSETVTAHYLEEWDFFLTVLRRGVYVDR